PFIYRLGPLIAYALTIGLAGGLITVVYFTFYGLAYGRKHLALIQGTAHWLTVIATAQGPVLLTWCQGLTGSYDGLFLVMSPVLGILAAAAWFVSWPCETRWSCHAPRP